MSKQGYYHRLKLLLDKRRSIELGVKAKQEKEIFEKYKVEEVHDHPIKAMSVQLKETNGELPFDESNYHCAEYRNLMKNVSDLRQKYQSSSDSDERKQLASKEAFHWYNYLENREQALPESYKMSNTTLSLLEESFERESERRNKKIRSDRIVDFHYSYAKVRRFDIPIHSRNLIQMIHPYNGYLCNVPDKVFTFEEIIKIYRQQLVSSYERNLGQTLLAGNNNSII